MIIISTFKLGEEAEEKMPTAFRGAIVHKRKQIGLHS